MLCFASPPSAVPRPRSRGRSRVRVTCGVPRNLNEVVRLSARSIDRAADASVRRMQLSALVPGLNPALEDSFPYNERLLLMLVRALVVESAALRAVSRVALLFKSEGTAASARAVYSGEVDLPEHVTIASYFVRDLGGGGGESRLADGDGFNVVVNPVSARGNPVILDIMALVQEQPDARWILLNPDFSADRSALGMREVERRQQFLDQFKQVFYFRNLFIIKRPKMIPVEKGALLYIYGDSWSVFCFQNDEYESVAEFSTEPDRTAITAAIENAPAIKAMGVSENDVIQDKEYLTSISVLAVVVSGLFWFLRSYPLE